MHVRAPRVLQAISLDETERQSAQDEGRPPPASVASKVATQKNEVGQAALWAAIETKSDLALKLIDVPEVNNNETNEVGTTPLMRMHTLQRPNLHQRRACMLESLLATEMFVRRRY